MEPGKLRHTVEIQETADVYSPTGVASVWSTIAKRKAMIKPTTADEFMEGDRTGSVAPRTLVMRYYSGKLTPAERLLFAGRTYEIQSVANVDERKRMMEVRCKEVTS